MKRLMGGDMIRYLLMAIIICLTITTESQAGNKQKTYWIDANVSVLAFIGDPNTLDLIPVRMTTYEKQVIQFFHGDSGYGVRAFYLPNLIIHSEEGRKVVTDNGYFLIKLRHVKTFEYKIKSSLKRKTKGS